MKEPNLTHKDEFDFTHQRVQACLVPDAIVEGTSEKIAAELLNAQHFRIAHMRTAQLLGLLIEHLESKGLLSEKEIDKLLLQISG